MAYRSALKRLSASDRISAAPPSVHLRERQIRPKEEELMAQKESGYGGKWKKWLAIYIAVGAVVYMIVYLLFFRGGGGGY
jgi:hypothetical protein